MDVVTRSVRRRGRNEGDALAKGVASLLLLALIVAAVSARAGEPALEASSVHLKLVEQVDVPAREEGILSSVAAEEGQTITAGQLLAQIADEEVQLARQRAELELLIAARAAQDDSAVRSSEEGLRVAEADVKHAQDAQQRIPDVLSATELDHLQLALVRAESALLQAKNELAVRRATRDLRQKDVEFAELKCRQHRLVSPLNGMVVQLYQRPGQWVQAGDKVMRVIRLDELRAEGFLQLDDACVKLTGTPVSVTVNLPGGSPATYRGTVVFVSPEIDPLNRRVRVWANVKNTDLKLRPGMSAKMKIQVP